MTVRVIALVKINENEPMALAAYLEATTLLLERVGAKILERIRLDEALAGETEAETMIVFEYPDRDAVDRVFASEAYRSILPVRDRAFACYSVSVVAG